MILNAFCLPFMHRAQWRSQEDSKAQAELLDRRILGSRMTVWSEAHTNLPWTVV